ncbi:MAG: universal stress protein [Deltaproteobacteria bacterium]|nr:universal stress protein [Deltaproteobacteria bacterium]
MTILCGTDLSEHAARAVNAAAAIAARAREPLKLVHVIDELGAELTEASADNVLYDGRRRALAELAGAVARRFDVQVEHAVIAGFADEKLVEQALACHARLIVVAALGSKRQLRWLLGSVAERVVQASPVPVLVVRDAASVEEWAAGKRPLRVMVGVEVSRLAKEALVWAAGLRELGRCELHAAQVAPLFEGPAARGLSFAVPVDYLALTRELRAWAGELPGELPGVGATLFSVIPGANRVEQHLAAAGSAWRADLLVVGTHQRAGVARLWQGSVSRGVLHQATGNVVCVPRVRSEAELDDVPSLRRVLVPTDLSPAANRAVPFAYGVASAGGVVQLLHVVTQASGLAAPDAARRLRELLPMQASTRGIATEIEVVLDPDVCAAIVRAATQLGADAICMAATRRPSVDGGVLGATTQEVLRRAGLPMVLVPPIGRIATVRA